jgi:hypothetical protein
MLKKSGSLCNLQGISCKFPSQSPDFPTQCREIGEVLSQGPLQNFVVKIRNISGTFEIEGIFSPK